VFVHVLIYDLAGCGVIRRIDINTLHLLAIPRLQQIERLKILTMYQQAVELLVQVSEAGDESFLE
jgi:hypothetical protein